MDAQEASRRFLVPVELILDYESWRWGGQAGKDHLWTGEDIARLGLAVILRQAGAAREEVEEYLALGEKEPRRRLLLLDRHRARLLEEIHRREKLLEQLDGLRCQARREAEKLSAGRRGQGKP